MNSPELINGNDLKTTGKSIKIPEEEALRSSITMNHNQSRRAFFTIKGNRVDKSRLVTSRPEPSDVWARWPRAYIYLFLNISSSENQGIHPNQPIINQWTPIKKKKNTRTIIAWKDYLRGFSSWLQIGNKYELVAEIEMTISGCFTFCCVDWNLDALSLLFLPE